MKKIISNKCSVLLAGVFLLGLGAKAQSASTYSFAASSGTYSYLSGGTSVTSILVDDALSAAIPIGFTFNFCGTNYTDIKACSNGWMTFNTAVTSTLYTNSVANLATIKPALMPLFDDLDGSYGSASYLTAGTSPSRVFTFEYRNWDWNFTGGGVLSFQVKLYEGSNKIEYIYKRESSGADGATIGIGDGAATATYLSLNNATASPTASSSTFTTSISTRPANGQIYAFNQPPPTCTTPAPGATIATPSTLSCLGNSTVLSITTAPTGTGNTFQWQSSPDNATYTDIVGAISSSLTITPIAPTWYKCKVICANGPVTTASTAVQVTFSKNVSTVTNGVRCGTGTVALGAIGSSGTLNWYSAAIGGTAIGTGAPFTTPTISTTTPFYVGMESISAGDVTVGTGTNLTSATEFPTAFMNRYTQYWCQQVYTAAELTAAGLSAGNINSIKLNIAALGSAAGVTNFTVMMGNTSSTSLSSFTATGLSTVYGPSSYTSAVGSNLVTFSTPFNWDGTSNIILDIRQNGIDATNNATTYYTTTSGNTVVYAFTSSVSPSIYTTSTSASTSTSRMNVVFNGQTTCSSPRVAVTATVNTPPAFSLSGTQTVCNNNVATLNVTSPLTNFNTYVWTPAVGLFTDAACTIAYTAGSSASTVYAKTTTAGAITYKNTANNTTSFCTAIDSVKVTNLPSAIMATATPSSICLSGVVALTISPAASTLGAATFQWASSTDNTSFTDIASATAAGYTSPSIASTKYYRVNVKNSAGVSCLNSSSDTGLVYNPTVSTTTGASRCGPGSVTLNATGTDGVLNWYAASSGGTAIATGTSYTTPSLTATTTYYVASENSVAGSGTVGSGTTSANSVSGQSPFSSYYTSAHTQYLILASDLLSSNFRAGNLNSLSFNVTTKNSTKVFSSYTIKLASTTSTSLSGLLSPTFTTVYGASNYTSFVGSNNFNFATPFYWDGSSNLLVDVCFDNVTPALGYSDDDDAVSFVSKSYTATYGLYTDGSNLCGVATGGTSTSLSGLPVFGFNGTILCGSASRTPVTATINANPVPTISPATGPIQICEGNTTTFTGGGGGNYQWKNLSGNIAGATSSTYTTGTGGSYRVVVTTPATGCKDSTSFVAVNVNPTPTVSIAPAGTTFICADSALKFTSVTTGSGLTYQWFNSGTPISGAATNTYSASAAGVYTLRVYLGTCSDTSNEATLNINPLPASSFTKTGLTDAICIGDSLELTALTIPSSSTYQWMFNGVDIPGATSKIFNAKTGGVYSVRIKDANNCRKISDTMNVINTPMGIPNLLPKDVRFCEGTIIKLYSNAGPFGDTYMWTKDGSVLSDTTSNIATGIGGTFDVTVKDVFGCKATSEKVVITVDPLPVKPIIVKTGMVLSTAVPYTTYQWYRNGKMISGAISRSYTLMFDGKYHVVVTNNANCNNISDTLSVQNLSVQNLSRNDIEVTLYPNPSQSIVNIDAPIPVNLFVKDLQGKQILELKDAKQVDMGVYADGIYIFTITDKDGMVIKMDKVVKRTN